MIKLYNGITSKIASTKVQNSRSTLPRIDLMVTQWVFLKECIESIRDIQISRRFYLEEFLVKNQS